MWFPVPVYVHPETRKKISKTTDCPWRYKSMGTTDELGVCVHPRFRLIELWCLYYISRQNEVRLVWTGRRGTGSRGKKCPQPTSLDIHTIHSDSDKFWFLKQEAHPKSLFECQWRSRTRVTINFFFGYRLIWLLSFSKKVWVWLSSLWWSDRMLQSSINNLITKSFDTIIWCSVIMLCENIY